MPSLNAKTVAELPKIRAALRGAGILLFVLLAVSLGACSQRAGDLGRQNTDYIARNVLDPVDRHLLAGGKSELSRMPLSDEEQLMYDLLWRFFSAPHAHQWSPFGVSRVSPYRLKTGEAFERTDRYYSYLRHAGFKSSRTRYSTMTSHISADLKTLPAAFAAVCVVQTLDERRRVAASAFPELDTDEQQQLDMRLVENAYAIRLFARALDYRYQSYSYALKRLLVATPDEAARDVDARLSEFLVPVEAADRDDYCG